MSTRYVTVGVTIFAALASPAVARPAARQAASFAFHDRASGVSLRVPRIAELSRKSTGYTVHNSGGWRIVWDEITDAPGRLIVRLVISVVPKHNPKETSQNEALQLGISADPAALRSCFVFKPTYSRNLPNRTINGTRFVAWSSGDVGMSQSVGARSYRAILNGRCYAIDRISFGSTAGSNPEARVSEKAGAAAMDAALTSIRIAPPPR